MTINPTTEQAADVAAMRAELNRMYAADMDKLRAQVADLADKLHKANAQVHSLEKATTAYANENDQLRKVVERIAGLCNCRAAEDCPSVIARQALAAEKAVA